MNKSQTKSNSEHERHSLSQRLPSSTSDAQRQKTPSNTGMSQLMYPFLNSIDPRVMRKSLLGNGPKKINFCDTNISKRVLKTRNFEEFQQQSEEESDIKTPLSQEINENNIFDQITLKTDKVKQTEHQKRFLKNLGTRSLMPENPRDEGKIHVFEFKGM
jgi:hypothetical protein